jgi:heat shock protein HslJ
MKIITYIGILILVLNLCSCAQMKSSTAKSTKQTDTSMYFKANGNEPFWGLTISEKEIVLNTMQDTLTFIHIEPNRAMDSNVKLYKLESNRAAISIQITQQECVNDMSGESSLYSVTIDYKKHSQLASTKIKGCGSYLTDYRLNDIWVLEKLKGNKVSTDWFRDKLPTVEINTSTNSFSGFGGCNNMAGELFYEKGLLRFTKTITTMIYCENNKEKEFLSALNSATNYAIENNRLILSNPSKELLVLKKID